MHVALDLDDTITAHPVWFAWLASALRRDRHRITILTFRRDRPTTVADLARLGIAYDALELLPERLDCELFEWKAQRCRALGVDVLVEDMPENANRVDRDVLVLVPRAPALGNLTYAAGTGD